MAKRRSDQTELESCQLLAGVIKPDFVHENVYYPDPDQPGNLAELDILLGVDDVLFLVEVKAGGFSRAASRGADRSLAKELSELIIEGQRQSERAERYIRSADEVAFFDLTGTHVICNIRRSDYRRLFRVVVTREGLGWVGAQISILSVLDPTLSQSFPWHVSIDDLRVVAELFKDSELRFAHFLERRLKASAERRLSQNDEIEHIALYNKLNDYSILPVKDIDHMSFDTSYMRDIDSYFMAKVSGESPAVPTPALPPKTRAFINGLQQSGLTNRFEVASLVLSLGAEGRRISKNRRLRFWRLEELRGYSAPANCLIRKASAD